MPILARLKKNEENLEDLSKIKKSTHFLLKWVNYHLSNGEENLQISNFGEDLKVFSYIITKTYKFVQDGKAYITLLSELKNESNYSSQFSLPENEQANKILEDSKALGVPEFVKQEDILRGNELINFLFCSELFLAKHGLPPFEHISEDEKKSI